MKLWIIAAFLSAGLVSNAASARVSLTQEQRSAETSKAYDFILSKQPAEAINTITPVLAAFDEEFADSKDRHFCAEGSEQTLKILLGATIGIAAGTSGSADKASKTVIIAPTYCDALFIKGFALVDVNQSPAARVFLQKASETAPLNAHYKNEYAEWHKANRDWRTSFALFESASALTVYSPEPLKNSQKARSLRGMGFNLIELGDLDKAEKLFKDSQKLDPENKNAQIELEYIAGLRAKKGAVGTLK